MNADRKPFSTFERPIVVGVDEKPHTEHVARMADELGRKLAVPVHRVHAVPRLPDVWPGLDPARGEALTVELLDSARKAVEARVRPIVASSAADGTRSGQGGKSRKGGTAVLEDALVDVFAGHPPEVLLKQARRRKAGMLVLGTHEKRSILDFGNTLRAVYAKSPIPVWVQPGPVSPIRRVLVGLDLSEDSLLALDAACAIARSFGAAVHAAYAFHVNAVALAGQIDSTWGAIDFPYEEVLRTERVRFEKAMNAFDWRGVAHETELVEETPVDALLELSKAADLVVVGTHGRTGLASVVLGGVAYAILKRSSKPTLAVPRADRPFRI